MFIFLPSVPSSGRTPFSRYSKYDVIQFGWLGPKDNDFLAVNHSFSEDLKQHFFVRWSKDVDANLLSMSAHFFLDLGTCLSVKCLKVLSKCFTTFMYFCILPYCTS